MTDKPSPNPTHLERVRWRPMASESPFIRAPEAVWHIYTITILAACLPLLAGVVFFGWRAAMICVLSVLSCVVIEWLYYRVTRWPALLGRSHAVLTGVLLAATLPPFVPWYVPVVAAAFAIIVGKAVFGGVGHFLWQPAIVGRLAVMVIFQAQGALPVGDANMNPAYWPVLAQDKVVVGNVDDQHTTSVQTYTHWYRAPSPVGQDGFRLRPPAKILASLTRGDAPEYSSLAYSPPSSASPAALTSPATTSLSPIGEMFIGARPGGIGETSIIIIIIAGLYLIYRNYVKWQLPLAIILSAAFVAAIAPIQLAGPDDTTIRVWYPILGDRLDGQNHFDVGLLYLCYQLCSSELILVAFFLAPEMTTRPVTTGGQVLFGIGCGVAAMLMKLYFDTSIPAYLAVLAMNTLTPAIDSLWRPKVLGQSFWQRWFG